LLIIIQTSASIWLILL